MNDEIEWYHIYPINDLIEHNTESKGTDEFICQCNPTIDVEDYLIIHDPMDRREVSE